MISQRKYTYYSSHSNTEDEVYFYHSDHLGSASWITDISGTAIQHLQYLPFGERYVDQRVAGYHERFTFTGKEKDEETGYGYFGARYMDHELMTMFLSVDRYASRYPSISPYVYCAWNPVILTDPSGDTIVIEGKFYYSPGMSYAGNDKFVQQTVSALNTLNGTKEGSKIISSLHTSTNTFSIKKAESGGSCFNPSDPPRAYAKQIETDPSLRQQFEYYSAQGALSGGSGGDVYWYPGGTPLPIISGDELGIDICPQTDLGHELSHAFDANSGLMDNRIHYLDANDKIGVTRNDWNAVYRENMMRQQLGEPLRTHYHKKMEKNLAGIYQVTGGNGPFMLKNGKPYLPNW